MKRSVFLIALLAAISVVSGQLMSHSSWIGKVGMTFMHQEYNFTKVWWEGALFAFVFLLFLYLIHSLVQLFPAALARTMHFLLLLAAGTALYLTYDDFHTDITHKLLKHRFHYGVYLLWVGWIVIALFFLFSRRRLAKAEQAAENTTK